jgi:hypothetical protein
MLTIDQRIFRPGGTAVLAVLRRAIELAAAWLLQTGQDVQRGTQLKVMYTE